MNSHITNEDIQEPVLLAEDKKSVGACWDSLSMGTKVGAYGVSSLVFSVLISVVYPPWVL